MTLALAGGYTNATLTTAIPSLGVAAGARVEGVPDWNANTSVEYQRPLFASISGVARADYSFVGESHGTLTADNPDYDRPAYGLAGASVGARFAKWEISVFARISSMTRRSYKHRATRRSPLATCSRHAPSASPYPAACELAADLAIAGCGYTRTRTHRYRMIQAEHETTI